MIKCTSDSIISVYIWYVYIIMHIQNKNPMKNIRFRYDAYPWKQSKLINLLQRS